MAGFELINTTPSPNYVLDEEKERRKPLASRLLDEIAMMQHYEHHVDPTFREFHQNVKARLGLLEKDLRALEHKQQEIEDDSRPG